nr:SAM-dependent DNA methyltransferase [Micromonospora sp. DSM 115978]
AKPIARAVSSPAEFAAALAPLLGTGWKTWAEASSAMRARAQVAGLPWPRGATFDRALRDVIGVRDPDGQIQRANGVPEADPELRDHDNVPLGDDLDGYAAREILPHVPDAWIDHGTTKVGYEIPFGRHFYVPKPLRPVADIDAEITALDDEIRLLTDKLTG